MESFINVIVALIGYRVSSYDFPTLYFYISVAFSLLKAWNDYYTYDKAPKR